MEEVVATTAGLEVLAKDGQGSWRRVSARALLTGTARVISPRWTETALEIMAEHVEESKPSRMMVIRRTAARLETRHGPGEIELPSRATAFRILEELEQRQPIFRLSTKRNRWQSLAEPRLARPKHFSAGSGRKLPAGASGAANMCGDPP
ncbi:hypothetical protein [Nonomuraea sediminis]|uniref:hypothetical protein n=1 Tax=Nonomuraea sediminis TaxID=2835864 RepID=UPI001BDC2538|nr:hypothetical protein [Nonomuraea sediminis]